MQKFLFQLYVLMMCPVSWANAAGFDCQDAKTKVEHLICSDTQLSAWDERLNDYYAQAVSFHKRERSVRRAQRTWLQKRNRCKTLACLKEYYQHRLKELLPVAVDVDNDSLCEGIRQSVNRGDIAKRILSFRLANEQERAAWRSRHDFLYLNNALTIYPQSKAITLGRVTGGGTCGNCDLVDLSGQREIDTSEYDDEELRWKGWGQCEHFLYFEGVPVILTGKLGFGHSRISFVETIDDQGRRLACRMGEEPGSTPILKAVHGNAKVCRAFSNNKVKWLEREQAEEKIRGETGRTGWTDHYYKVDIDLDGKPDKIDFYDNYSGAGCGSYDQWLLGDSPYLNTAFERYSGNIRNSSGDGPYNRIGIFVYQGKPYLMVPSQKTNIAIISLWQEKKREWCGFDLLPRHVIK